MHIYQKNILDKLRGSTTMRYSQLQPGEVESSHFKYHLNQLIKDGLVEQRSRGVYALTIAGKSMVDRLSSGKVNPRLTPKVITYTLLYDEKNYYLQRKIKEPYAGLINMIGGKVHVGEATVEAAKREVFEKTKYEPNNLHLCGIAEIRITQKSVLLSHAVAYIYYAKIADSEAIGQSCTAIGKGEIKQQADLAPDCLSIIEAIVSSKQIFAINLAVDYAQ